MNYAKFSIQRKYQTLHDLLMIHCPDRVDKLEYIALVHHGMPDFICYHAWQGFKFVECKLGYEHLSPAQLSTIQMLQQINFVVEIHKIVYACTKTRLQELNPIIYEKRIKEKEMTVMAYARNVK